MVVPDIVVSYASYKYIQMYRCIHIFMLSPTYMLNKLEKLLFISIEICFLLNLYGASYFFFLFFPLYRFFFYLHFLFICSFHFTHYVVCCQFFAWFVYRCLRFFVSLFWIFSNFVSYFFLFGNQQWRYT